MIDLPEPLVSAEIDLKGFPGFVFDVERFLASELLALGSQDEISAALMLWCRAWQQTPHGSLPNDERVLAAFSKAKNWKKVREQAMRGFVLCSDGRLYHKFLCKKVLEAWEFRKAHLKKREKDAERLRDWRDKKQRGNGTGNDDETRFDGSTKSVGSEGEVKGSEFNSDPNGSGGAPPAGQSETAKTPEEMTKVELWRAGKSVLLQAGMPKDQCGTFVGMLCKDYGDDIVIEAVREAVLKQPADPASFLKAACMARKGEGGKTLIPWHATDAGVLAKGLELDPPITPRAGEYPTQFKTRVIAAMENGGKAPVAAPAAVTPVASEPEKADQSEEAVAARNAEIQRAREAAQAATKASRERATT